MFSAIRKLRVQMGISSSELCHRMHARVDWLSKVESGRLELDSEVLRVLAHGFGVDVPTLERMLCDCQEDYYDASWHEIHIVSMEDDKIYYRLRGNVHLRSQGIGLSYIRTPDATQFPIEEGHRGYHAHGSRQSMDEFKKFLRLCNISYRVIYALSSEEETKIRLT